MFDPLYLVIMLPALAFALFASWRTRSAFNKYTRVRTLSGLTGAQAAGCLGSRPSRSWCGRDKQCRNCVGRAAARALSPHWKWRRG